MPGNGTPVSFGRFDEFERRVDSELARVNREIDALRGQLAERRGRTWTLGLALLTGVALPILGALLAVVFRFGP